MYLRYVKHIALERNLLETFYSSCYKNTGMILDGGQLLTLELTQMANHRKILVYVVFLFCFWLVIEQKKEYVAMILGNAYLGAPRFKNNVLMSLFSYYYDSRLVGLA